MLKTTLLVGGLIAIGATPALAQSPSARRADQAAKPAAAVVSAPTIAVVVDPDAHAAVVVPVNPQSDVAPDVTAALEGLLATGKVKPGQIVQIVVRRGGQVTEVISNAPIPNPPR